MDIENLNVKELIGLYSNILKILKRRNVIRTKNFVGEIGEYLVIDYYNNTTNLPKLQAAPISTKNIDAISKDGRRYSIKTTTSTGTGVFYGLEPPGSDKVQEQLFEFVIVVQLDDNYEIRKITEMPWDDFFINKRWHSRMQAWNLSVTKIVLKNSKIIFNRS